MKNRILFAALSFMLLSASARAGEDLPAAALFPVETDIRITTDIAADKKTIVVGGIYFVGDGFTATTWDARVIGFSAKTGAELWRDDLATAGQPDAVTSVAVDKKCACAAGIKADDDGDGGGNAFVRCYAPKDGSLLWDHEYEHPAGPASFVGAVVDIGSNDETGPTVRIAGKRVILTVRTQDPVRRIDVVAFDKKTGDPI